MSLVTIIWSVIAGVSLAFFGVYFLVWLQNRRAWANLAFSMAALGVSCDAILELGMMLARTPEAWALCLRWAHLSSFVAIAGALLFVHFYMGTGRRWLLRLTIGLRFFTLLVNFCLQPNLNYREIHSLRQVSFLGEQVSIIGAAVPNPLMWLAQFCYFLWLVYTVDAMVTLWRRNHAEARRTVLTIGVSTTLFISLGMSQAVLTLNGLIDMPMIPSAMFLFMVLAVGHELSREILRAARVSQELRVTERRLTQAASAARAVLWEWQVDQDTIWASADAREVVGVPAKPTLSFQEFLANLHPDDRPRVLQLIRQTATQLGSFNAEYRRILADGTVRWVAGSGSAERDPQTGTTLLRGISLDITARREVEAVAARQRHELTHMGRVSMMGQLAASLAHELNQPLGAILRNAEAAEIFLQAPSPDLVELRAIVEDIRKDDARAGTVINRMRAFLQRQEVERRPIDLNQLATEVIGLVRPDADLRNVRLAFEPGETPPPVSGDRIQLQQVLVNLLLNAMDALPDSSAPESRRVSLQVRPAGAFVEVAVRDTGHGIPPDKLASLFEPFYTTKTKGLGMGLSISRNIVEAHGGQLWADNNPDVGATFRFTLPVAKA